MVLNMRECKIVYNQHNGSYSVVELNENEFACPIGQGRTKSAAAHDAYKANKFCRQVSKNGNVEEIIVLFNYEE